MPDEDAQVPFTFQELTKPRKRDALIGDQETAKPGELLAARTHTARTVNRFELESTHHFAICSPASCPQQPANPDGQRIEQVTGNVDEKGGPPLSWVFCRGWFRQIFVPIERPERAMQRIKRKA
jgi:hypothetical protein